MIIFSRIFLQFSVNFLLLFNYVIHYQTHWKEMSIENFYFHHLIELSNTPFLMSQHSDEHLQDTESFGDALTDL